jgi:hypothetical protein
MYYPGLLLYNTKRVVTFLLQQWLRERATVSRYKHIACLVYVLTF